MTANVNFVFANRDGVLRVPNAALRFRPTPEMLSALGMDAKRVRPGHSAPGAGVAAAAPRSGANKAGTPSAALGTPTEDAPDRRTVWVLRGGLPQSTGIKIGASDGTKTEVVEGALAEGDLVISDATLAENAKPSRTSLPGAPAGGHGRRPF
jgi:HlyD family secretion protein